MGLGKNDSKPPPAPDPAATAQAQGSENRKAAIATARLNQINEVTPFGSLTYEPTGKKVDGIRQFQRTVELSPEQEKLLGLEQGINEQIYNLGSDQLGRIGEAISDPLSLENLPDRPTINDQTRQRVEDALYDRMTSRLDPRFEQQQRSLENQLVNQGFSRGTEGYTQALEDFRRSEADAYQQALSESILAGGQEQSRLFGLGSQARQQALQEQLTARNQPINELAGLLGQSSGVSVPQFSPAPTSQVAPADITGPTALQYQGQLNAFNQERADDRALMGSIFGLGGTALGGWASGGFKGF